MSAMPQRMVIWRSSITCLCLLGIWCLPYHSQVTYTPKLLDFGTTNTDTEWIRDVVITNTSGKKDFLLRHTFSPEYEVLFTSKTLLPDSSITMRVKFKPRNKGTYRERVALYFASMQEPVWLDIYALVDYKNPMDNIPCPDFSRLAAECCPQNMCLIEVKNLLTGEPIPQAEIQIAEQGRIQKKLTSGKDGKISFEIPIGYYEITVKSEGYETVVKTGYINKRSAYSKFLLNPTADTPPDVMVPKHDEAEPIIENDFSVEQYRPNNIVFLLDISGSMAQSNKLELMQGTILEFSKIIRPVDQIGLVTYADHSGIVLSPTTGDNKNPILAATTTLKIGGNTNAPEGFKTALKTLQAHELQGGNNQLFVISDGAFAAKDQKPILKMVRKAARKGFSVSIVGIKSNTFAQNNLRMVSEQGNGSFLQIDSTEDLILINTEIKQRSKK